MVYQTKQPTDLRVQRPDLQPVFQPVLRPVFMAVAALTVLTLAGCQSTSNSILTPVDLAQGSSENISSLTTVIQSNPRKLY